MKKLQLLLPVLLLSTALPVMSSWGVSGQMTQTPLAEENQLTDRERLLRLEQQMDKLSGMMAALDVKQAVSLMSSLRRELTMLKVHVAHDASDVKANLDKVNDHLQRLDSRSMTAKGDANLKQVSSVDKTKSVPQNDAQKSKQALVNTPKPLPKVAEASPLVKSKPVESHEAEHKSKDDGVVVAFE